MKSINRTTRRTVARARDLIAEALLLVAHVRKLSSALGQRAELASAMKAVEGLIGRTFLRSGGR